MTCPLPPPLLHSVAWGIFLIGMLGAWGLCSWIAARGIFSARRERASATPEDASAVAAEKGMVQNRDYRRYRRVALPGGRDMQQLSLIEAMEGREEILSAVAERNKDWMAEAMRVLEGLPEHQEGTGEDFRLRLTEAGVEAPAHVNAWGALFGLAGKRGVLAKTGEWRAMKRANGRSTPVYRRAVRQLEPVE